MGSLTRYWEIFQIVQNEVKLITSDFLEQEDEILREKLARIQGLSDEFEEERKKLDDLGDEGRARFSNSLHTFDEWIQGTKSVIGATLAKRESEGESTLKGDEEGAIGEQAIQSEKTVEREGDSEGEPFLGFPQLTEETLETSNFLKKLMESMEEKNEEREGDQEREQDREGDKIPMKKGAISKHEKVMKTENQGVNAHHASLPQKTHSNQAPQGSSTPHHSMPGTSNQIQVPMGRPTIEQVPNNVPTEAPTQGHNEPIYNPMGAHGGYEQPSWQEPRMMYPAPQFRMQVENYIKIPHFDGKRLEDWVPFKSAFVRFVHNSPYLDNLSKLAHLLQHISGEAKDTISGFPFQENQYQGVWTVLNKRYNREDYIVEETIAKLLKLPGLRGQVTSEKLSSILNVTNQMLRTLPTFGIDVTSWDPILKHILIDKFDDELRADWKVHIGTNQSVPLNTLLDFLEVKMFTVGKQGSRGQHQVIGPRRPVQVYQVTEERCPQCNENHPLYRCRNLWKMTAKERTQELMRLKLCFKCLKRHGGKKEECTIGDCPVCGGPHNTLICYKKERDFKEHGKKREEPRPGPSQDKGGEGSNAHHA